MKLYNYLSATLSLYNPGGHSNIKWITLPKAGAFKENTVSKNDRSLGEKPNLAQNLGALGENVAFDLSVSALKAGIKTNRRKWQK